MIIHRYNEIIDLSELDDDELYRFTKDVIDCLHYADSANITEDVEVESEVLDGLLEYLIYRRR
jgi:hypothetical protein